MTIMSGTKYAAALAAQATTLQEEVDAALLEGKKAMPETLVELHKEYNDINEMIAELEARKTHIKTIVGLQADMDGVSMYTVNSVNKLGFNSRTTVNVDKKKLMNEFPEVFDAVTSTSTSQTFYSAK
jgi:hypothetical protein